MMIPAELQELIDGGESITVEFKESHADLTKDVYQTVCSFSNRNGGHIFLGVRNDGAITGIQKDKIDKIKKQFVTTVNNEKKLYPPLYLTPVSYEAEGKEILYVRVPVSQDVVRCSGRIWDRNQDADIDITYHSDEVYRLYARKRGTFFVNKVTRFGLDALRSDLLERGREMTRARVKNHPWKAMADEEMLRSAGLILADERLQIEGVTYAGILLFGKDSTIMSVMPQHKTDAIFRMYNADRYDDRDVVITNLLESYDRLMAFGRKHLNDTFHLDGIQSVSPRDNILREIISNLLAHRDYSSAYVAKLVIEKERIFTENANLSHGHGALQLSTFEPFPKNPPISRVFRELGLADELGSGMRNTYKYTKMYSGSAPQFVEGNIFRITIPLTEIATATVGPGGSTPYAEHHPEAHAEFCGESRSEFYGESHVEPLGKSHVESRGESHVESQGESHVEPQGESHVEPQGESHVEPQGESHVESQGESHSEFYGESHVEPLGESHVESRSESHVELQGESHVEPHGESHVEPQGESHVEPQGESHAEPLGESHVESQGESHVESHGESHAGPSAEAAQQIYAMIRENPHVTRREMAQRLGLSLATISRRLKGMDGLRYVGSGNNGQWELTDAE